MGALACSCCSSTAGVPGVVSSRPAEGEDAGVTRGSAFAEAELAPGLIAEGQGRSPSDGAEPTAAASRAPAEAQPAAKAVQLPSTGQPQSSDARKKAVSEARALLDGLRVCEAAALLEKAVDSEAEEWDEGAGEGLLEAAAMHLRALGSGLQRLGGHPGLRGLTGRALEAATGAPETILGVAVPASPSSVGCRSPESRTTQGEVTSADERAAGERDVLNVDFELDDHGRRVEVCVEFFPDGSASIQWVASDLPVPMPYVVCLVHEVDLLGNLAPFILSSSVVKQFPWNQADRLIRVVSKPPIPFVTGLESLAQRYCFDLLDTPWEAFCLVEEMPQWAKAPAGKGEQWRGVPRPPPYQRGMKQVELRSATALGCPVGARGELTTILFSARGVLKVPRSLLPNWLVSWLVKTIGRFIYQQALNRVAEFDTSEFAPRLKSSSFYATLHERIARFVEAKEKAAAAPFGGMHEGC